MKCDLADNSVFIIPDIDIFEKHTQEYEVACWPLIVLHDFYWQFSLEELAALKDCKHWRTLNIPDWVITHADSSLSQRVEIELARNPMAYVTQAVCDEDEVYAKLLPYNKLIEII